MRDGLSYHIDAYIDFASPNIRRYLSREQFAKRFAPCRDWLGLDRVCRTFWPRQTPTH
jgi:hypothetical protein